MWVCSCRALRERDLRDAARRTQECPFDAMRRTGAGGGCGGCVGTIRRLADEETAARIDAGALEAK